MPEMKWLKGSHLRGCARSTAPTSAVTSSRRCGQPSRPITIPQNRESPPGLSPHQILLGKDPLGRVLSLSGDGMAMDAKDISARHETTARELLQQLEKEHAVQAQTTPKWTGQKFTVVDHGEGTNNYNVGQEERKRNSIEQK